MDAGEIADTMTGTTPVIDAQLPQGTSGQNVQVDTPAAVQEDSVLKGKYTAADGGEVQLQGVRDLAQGDGTGDVGGTFIVLSAGVHQVEAAQLQVCILARLCSIMHHGGIGAVCTDGAEGRFNKAGLLLAEFLQLFFSKALGHPDFGFADGVLEPVHEPGEGHAIPQMGETKVFDLHRILDRFHQLFRIGFVYDLGFEPLYQIVVDLGQIQQDLLLCRNGSSIVVDFLISLQLDAGSGQSLFHSFAQGIGIHKEDSLAVSNGCIGEQHGSIGDVVAADVEEPGNIVQGGEQMDASMFLLHGIPYPLNLLGGILAGVFFLQQEGRLCAESGTVFPDHAHQIQIAAHLPAAFFGSLTKPVSLTGCNDPAVKSQGLSGLHGLFQILLFGGNTRFSHLEEGDGASFQLISCLDEVAAVGPEARFGTGYNDHTGGTGKAGDPGAAFEVIAYIF